MLVLSRIALFLTFGFTLCINPTSLFAQSFNTNSGNDDVKFVGTIESLPSSGSLLGDWRVAGKTVRVTSSTKIEQERGQAVVGAEVEVEAVPQSDGSFLASEVKVVRESGGGGSGSEVKFYGVINSLPPSTDLRGNWVVEGRNVLVTASTSLDQSRGSFAVGVRVEVEGHAQSDGSVTASSIHVDDNSTGGGSEVKFYGVISSLPAASSFIGDWVVDGKTVHVTASTSLDQSRGSFAVGVRVEVEGTSESDGSVTASSIHVDDNSTGGGSEVKFYGVISSLPAASNFIGDWVVDGKTVHVTASTSLDQSRGSFAVGVRVEVEGTSESDGSVTASSIHVDDNSTGGSGGMYIKFYDRIQTLPTSADLIGTWQVGGRSVQVTSSTQLDRSRGNFAVGVLVEVEGSQQTDGTVLAKEIHVESSGGGGSSSGSYFEFYGVIETQPAGTGFVGDWTIAGRTVRVTSSTSIETRNGTLQVGALVEVKGVVDSAGVVTASRIEVKSSSSTGGGSTQYSQFYGSIEALPTSSDQFGEWRISGRTVTVNASTYIDREHGPAVVGAYVEVEGLVQADGSFTATKIEIKEKTGSNGRSSFHGIVETLPETSNLVGEWKVSGRIVRVTTSTKVSQRGGSITVGTRVEVKGSESSDGSVTATKVKRDL